MTTLRYLYAGKRMSNIDKTGDLFFSIDAENKPNEKEKLFFSSLKGYFAIGSTYLIEFDGVSKYSGFKFAAEQIECPIEKKNEWRMKTAEAKIESARIKASKKSISLEHTILNMTLKELIDASKSGVISMEAVKYYIITRL